MARSAVATHASESSVRPSSSPPRIFVHDLCWPNGELDPAREGYAQRALLMAGERDIVVLDAPIEGTYLDYLRGLKVGPTSDNVVVVPCGTGQSMCQCLPDNASALAAMRRHLRGLDTAELDVYTASTPQRLAGRRLESLLGLPVRWRGGDGLATRYANDKARVRAAAAMRGIPVAPGEVIRIRHGSELDVDASSRLVAAIQRQARPTGRAIVRGAAGAGGTSTYIALDCPASIRETIEKILADRGNSSFLVEQMVEVSISPNILMQIDPATGEPTLVGTTDQRLDRRLHHTGNLWPSRAQTRRGMEDSARLLAEWLWRIGYAGTVGFDFVEYRDARCGQTRYLLAEINARVNGSSYPLALVQRLNSTQAAARRPFIGAFLAGTIRAARSFAEVTARAGQLLYRAHTGRGIIPYRLNCRRNQEMCLVALAGSTQAATDLFDEAAIALLA